MEEKINRLFWRVKKFMGLDLKAVSEGEQIVNGHLVSEHTIFELLQQFSRDARGGGCLLNGDPPLGAQGADVAAHSLYMQVVLFVD